MRTLVSVGALALAVLVVTPSTVHAAAAEGVASAVRSAPSPPSPSPSALSGVLREIDPAANVRVRTVRYGKHARQRMDVYQHPDKTARPGVFLIHGGWWNSGDKRYLNSVARHYAGLGYTVFNLNYRLAQHAAWPAQRTDALYAIATARRHAALFGFDPNRYVIIGFSAGGHIATAVGTYRNGLPGLKGVVGVSPVVSPLTAYSDGDVGAAPEQRKLRKAAIRLAGNCHPTGKCAKRWMSMEVPWHASKGDAPVLTVHSTEEFVPPYHSELLQEQLAKAGVAMNIRTVPGTAHSTALYRQPGIAETIQSWVSAKLSPPGPPTGAQQ